ncbi:MAG: glycosyltransferase [Sphingobium sp.]
MSISVLTIVKNRADHLAQLIEGLRRSSVQPDELVIVDMGSDPAVARHDAPFPVTVVRLADGSLPLAAARNSAARASCSEHLLFLDVDCIAMRELVGGMDSALAHHDGLICAEALYLGASDARGIWTEEALRGCAQPHPVRSFPAAGLRGEANAGLFWSLVFGIRHDRFTALGGFDEAFTGYGAEDTDFGFRAQRAGIPLIFMGGAGAFHQHHPVFDPPLHHIEDIVRNAQLFHDRWQIWPMEGWLEAFARSGLVDWSGDKIALLRLPTAEEVAGAQRFSAF